MYKHIFQYILEIGLKKNLLFLHLIFKTNIVVEKWSYWVEYISIKLRV